MRRQSDDAAETEAVTKVTPRSRIVARCGRRWRLRRRWRRDERGSAAIEFAIIAPIFFFLMFVIAETALVFIAEQVMDNAVFETARLIRTGQVQTADMSKADFRTKVCNRVSVFINCSGSQLLSRREVLRHLRRHGR